MRRGEKEIVDRAQIDEIMNRALVCRIALCADGVPYVVPVSFGYGDGCVYIHSALEGRKMDTFSRNPQVSFEVDIDHSLVEGKEPCSYTFNYRSVVGFGTASVLSDPAEKRKGMDCIIGHYARGVASYPDDALKRTAVVRIEISSMTGKQSGY